VIPTRNLMIRLQERTHSLYSAPEATFGPQVRHFVQWLESEPVFATSLAELPHIELSAEEWLQQNVKYGEGLNVSAEEDKAVAELWQVVLHLAAQENVTSAAFKLVVNFLHGTGNTSADANRACLEIFVDPVVAWLKERLLKDDLLLHSLDRYAREAAWFRRTALREAYQADTEKGEKILDHDLRHALFRDGVDFPFSQAQGPSGRPDIVVSDDEAEPLPLEVKVFDPERGRNESWIRAGFSQAIDYAHDYRRADGYLAIFDVSPNGLAVEGDDPKSRIPTVLSDGVTVFVVTVPIGLSQPASKRRQSRVVLQADGLRS
jgi:hypothetical protein